MTSEDGRSYLGNIKQAFTDIVQLFNAAILQYSQMLRKSWVFAVMVYV